MCDFEQYFTDNKSWNDIDDYILNNYKADGIDNDFCRLEYEHDLKILKDFVEQVERELKEDDIPNGIITAFDAGTVVGLMKSLLSRLQAGK